jgi:hypothetical protein
LAEDETYRGAAKEEVTKTLSPTTKSTFTGCNTDTVPVTRIGLFKEDEIYNGACNDEVILTAPLIVCSGIKPYVPLKAERPD